MREFDFDFFCKTIAKRLKIDYDLVIAVTGTEGVGKSTFAAQAAKKICKYNNVKFSFEENEIYSPTIREINDKNTKIPQYSSVVVDEAVKVAYKQDWFKGASRFLSKLVKLFRQENKCWFLCIPLFRDLNTTFRCGRAKIWVHILSRGIAIVLSPDELNPLTSDIWHLDKHEKTIAKTFKSKKFVEISASDMANALLNTQLGSGIIQFDKLSPEEEQLYKELKSKYKYRDLDGDDDPDMDRGKREKTFMLQKSLMVNLLLNYGMSKNDICETIGVNWKSIDRWTKVWKTLDIPSLVLNYNNKEKLKRFIELMSIKDNDVRKEYKKDNIIHRDTHKEGILNKEDKVHGDV